MSADPNVQQSGQAKKVKIYANTYDGEWLDNGAKVNVDNGEFTVQPFLYGTSLSVRVLKFKVR